MSLLQKHLARYQALRDAAFKTPLLLIHPQDPLASLLLAKLEADETIPSYYYALQAGDEQLQAFMEHLLQALQEQAANSAGTLKAPSPAQTKDPLKQIDVLAEKLASTLNTLGTEPYLLLLDNFDQVDAADEVQPFISQLLNQLPAQAHLVLRVRQYPRLAWLALLARNQAAIFLEDGLQQEASLFYATGGETALEASAFGAGQVTAQGKAIEQWHGTLPRQLFFFILMRGQASRAEICQTFWPDLELEAAVNVFHVTKRRLHKALGMDLFSYEGDFYSLDPQFPIAFDVLEFLEAVMKARSAPDTEALPYWQEAVGRYRGPFLQGDKSVWAVDYRQALRDAYLDALEALLMQTKGQSVQVDYLQRYQDALSPTPQDAPFQRRLLELYGRAGQGQEATAYYRQLEKAFKEAEQKLPADFKQLLKNA